MFSKHWTPRGIVIKKHLFIKKTKVFSLLQLCILHINKIQGRKKHKGYLFAKISDNAAAYLVAKTEIFQVKKVFKINGKPGTNLSSHGHTAKQPFMYTSTDLRNQAR